MPDLNPIAKRIHNIQPRPVRLAIDGDDAGVFSSPRPSSSSGSSRRGSTDADGDAEFRLITSDDYESVLLGRSGPDEEGWTIVGEVTEAESAEE